MGNTLRVASGSACGGVSPPAGLGVCAAAAAVVVAVVVVVSASTAVEVTVVGGPAGACVLATVTLRGVVAGGSVGLEVIFVGPGNKIYFSSIVHFCLNSSSLKLKRNFYARKQTQMLP